MNGEYAVKNTLEKKKSVNGSWGLLIGGLAVASVILAYLTTIF